MKQMIIPTFKKVELTKQEKEVIKQNEDYCKQYLPKNTMLLKYTKNENDTLPISFRYIEKEEYNKYAIGEFKFTPYGIKKEILKEMKRNNILNIQERRNYSFDSFTTKQKWQKELKENAIKYVKDFNNKWFTVSGVSGSGKSHICTSIVFGLASKGIMVSYISWVDFKNQLKNNLDDAHSMIYNIKQKPVLYIDDFLKTGLDENRPTNYELESAVDIIWHRYTNDLPTIISTELDIEKEMMLINKAIAGRIVEMSKGYLNVIGNSNNRNYRIKGE